MRQSSNIPLKKNKYIFLNKNLSFNKTPTASDYFEEYYLHTMSKPLNRKEMQDYLNTFVKSRNRNSIESDSLHLINKNKFYQIEDRFEDEDFYVGFLGCLICREEFKTFIALFIHMKINHTSYDIFHSQILNPDTKLKEAHIIVFTNNSNDYDAIMTEDKSFCYVRDCYKEKEVFRLILLQNDITTIKEEGKCNNFQTQQITLNNLTSKNDKIKLKKYEDNEINRTYFHTVTGGILSEDSDDSDYELDEDDLNLLESKHIDSYTDICDLDKLFFKKWNRFLNKKKNVSFSNIDKILKEFVDTYGQELINEKLNENFILHLVNLYEHQQISSTIFADIIKKFNEKNNE